MSSCAAVDAVLDRRRRQHSELKARVSCAEERTGSLRQRLDVADSDRRRLEHDLNAMKDERENMSVTHYKLKRYKDAV